MSENTLIERLKESIIAFDEDEARKVAEEIVAADLDPLLFKENVALFTDTKVGVEIIVKGKKEANGVGIGNVTVSAVHTPQMPHVICVVTDFHPLIGGRRHIGRSQGVIHSVDAAMGIVRSGEHCTGPYSTVRRRWGR